MADFHSFMDVWGDYVLELNDEIDEQELEELYTSYLPEISELGRQPLFRGLNVDDQWISAFMGDKITEVGVHWTTDLDIAHGFSSTISHYDSRFGSQPKGKHVILQARNLDIKCIDVNATIAAMIAAGEREVRIVHNSPVFVASILIDNHWHMIGKTFRA